MLFAGMYFKMLLPDPFLNMWIAYASKLSCVCATLLMKFIVLYLSTKILHSWSSAYLSYLDFQITRHKPTKQSTVFIPRVLCIAVFLNSHVGLMLTEQTLGKKCNRCYTGIYLYFVESMARQQLTLDLYMSRRIKLSLRTFSYTVSFMQIFTQNLDACFY